VTWIESTGGPLILLEDRLLGSWVGTGTGVWKPGSGTDYDRACALDDWVGVIDVGAGKALVLGSEPTRTARLEAPGGALLVRWLHAPVGWQPDALETLLDQRWEPSTTWTITGATQTLLDAAEPGADEQADRLRLALRPGEYQVLTAEHRPDGETRMVLHWIRASGHVPSEREE
jgi:hypothetical protein